MWCNSESQCWDTYLAQALKLACLGKFLKMQSRLERSFGLLRLLLRLIQLLLLKLEVLLLLPQAALQIKSEEMGVDMNSIYHVPNGSCFTGFRFGFSLPKVHDY